MYACVNVILVVTETDCSKLARVLFVVVPTGGACCCMVLQRIIVEETSFMPSRLGHGLYYYVYIA